ncbi:amino acid permease [Tenacibaculum sp. 1_MG-2023]|uniref:amino acid permease n=1 Tax=Tenacibaculum sp. 1_MG-2023 TaxID=3062653 RepID=UPI0026E239E6|nr:amino acid permease [Tenacibaculum sp. 1_MG-2023]MDO6674587.1 amino acid permease [Tenacibaculum sp. 1_MG-2023]
MRNKLKKDLGLFDVFAISTGAMFSSGFFLLPGIASHYTGPSVFLAYLLAGVLILPTMFSIAEISTALPRSGGAYFFLDRSLGPLMGTIGGLGTYFALMLKTAFAIIGIGAYAAIFWEVPTKIVAIVATLFFMALNLVGAKKTSAFQKVFVIFLLIILVGFIADGLFSIFTSDTITNESINKQFTPFFSNGFGGMFTTIGFVFVSYLGLTQIVSVAEEIKNPERNIPLGMILSLVVTGLIYGLGVFIMVTLIEPASFANELAPAATAAEQLFKWLPDNVGVLLMSVAALAAFASTGNAGLLSASRYPFAMGRDKLFPAILAKIGKKGSPVVAIFLTTALIIVFILVLSEEGIVKLASTFQLLIFIFINFSVIVFRKSKIESYDPGYVSPLYPFMQVIGIVISFILIVYLGWMPILFTSGIIVIGVLWYHFYSKGKVKREGAIFHWFALLGRHQYDELENELMTILKEKGLREGDPFDETVITSKIKILKDTTNFDKVLNIASDYFCRELDLNKEGVLHKFFQSIPDESVITLPGILVFHAKFKSVSHPSMKIVISKKPIEGTLPSEDYEFKKPIQICAFLINSDENPKQQLRMLSRLLDILEREHIVKTLLKMNSHREIKEFLLQNERFVSIKLLEGTPQDTMIGKQLKDIQLPKDVLVALVERNNKTFTPNGSTVFLKDDVLTILGETKSIAKLYKEYMNYEINKLDTEETT